MKLVIFGLPASGKGTVSYHLENMLGIPQLSTGDLLRKLSKEDSPLGKEIQDIPVGHFASDELIIKAIQEELKLDKYKKGVIFDGFPRTESQAKKMIELDLIPDSVIFIKSNSEELIDRIINRRIHEPSGRIYNLKTKPPINEGIDDLTGEPLTHREDDQFQYIEKRFIDFKKKTLPAFNSLKSLCKYGKGPVLIEVEGMQSIDKVLEDLLLGIQCSQSIKKIRKQHKFTFVQTPFDHNLFSDKDKQISYARNCIRESLLRGEIPFSSNLFYFQKDLLDFKNEKHQKLLMDINKQLISKIGNLIIYSDPDIISPYSLNKITLEGKEIMVDKNTEILFKYAMENNIPISFRNNSNYKPNLGMKKEEEEEYYSEDSLFLGDTNFSKNSTFTIIESPYAGTIEEIKKNEKYAKDAVKDCLSKNEIPFASHLLYTQKGILDDKQSSQRRLGIEAGLIMGYMCNKTSLYQDLGISIGMEEGVDRANQAGRAVEFCSINKYKKSYKK